MANRRIIGRGGGGAGSDNAPFVGFLRTKQPWQWSEETTVPLLNGSGAFVPIGTVAVLSTTANSFTTSTTLEDITVTGVVIANTIAGALGRLAVAGKTLVRVAAGVTAGQHLRQSTTAGVAEGTAAPTQGTFAYTLTARDATTGLAEAILSIHGLADQAFATTWYRKTTAESVTNSTTFQDDDVLTGMAFKASSRYRVELLLQVAILSPGNIKLRFVDSTGAAGLVLSGWRTNIGDTTPTPFEDFVTNDTFIDTLTTDTNYAGPEQYHTISMVGTLQTQSAGTLKLQWAQNTADVLATSISEGYALLTHLFSL